MEKVKIKNCEPIFDGKAHSVEFVGGIKATAWNDKIDSGLLMQAYASGDEIEVDLKPYQSKAGKEGWNIIGINYAGSTMTSESPVINKNSPVAQSNGEVHSFKDMSIVSQVMVKCASEMYCSEANIEGSQCQYLANAINELTGAYKLALSNMKAL